MNECKHDPDLTGGVFHRFEEDALEVAERMAQTILDLAAPPKEVIE